MTWKGFNLLVLICGLIFVACGPAVEPEIVVEDYLQAVVSSDEILSANLACADWEIQARTDAAAFANVEARIEGLSCRSQGENEDAAVIECQGIILANYEGEDQEIRLNERNYRVVVEGGDWRVCGYP